MSAGPRRALSGIPIRKAGLQGHEGSSLRETFRQSDGQKTERGRKKEAKPHQKEERKKDVVFKNSFMKRSKGERGGGRRRRGLFPPRKTKTHKKTEERLHHRGAARSGFELPVKTTTAATHMCMRACACVCMCVRSELF